MNYAVFAIPAPGGCNIIIIWRGGAPYKVHSPTGPCDALEEAGLPEDVSI